MADDYERQVMHICKTLVDSIHSKHIDLSIFEPKERLRFVAKVIKLGDTFNSDEMKPVYGLLFTVEDKEDYLMRTAREFGLDEKGKVVITIERL